MYVCKFCIALHGLKLGDLSKICATEEDLFKHLKLVHNITITDDSGEDHELQTSIRRTEPNEN